MEIFFDLDGTLVEISERYYQLYSDIVKKLGGLPLEKSSYWRLKRSRESTELILFKSKLKKKKGFKVFSEEFSRKIGSARYLSYDRLFFFTMRLLDLLYKSHDLFLISYRKNIGNTKKQLARFGLINKFNDIRIGQLSKEGHLTKVEYIRKLTLGGKKLLIGDTDDDILAAKDVGAISVAVLSGIRDEAYLKKFLPNYISRNIQSLPSILEGIV